MRDILPDYGEGYLAKCLEAYEDNEEAVLAALLENNLLPALQEVPLDIPRSPPTTTAKVDLPMRDSVFRGDAYDLLGGSNDVQLDAWRAKEQYMPFHLILQHA